jgi:hypothetical protein
MMITRKRLLCLAIPCLLHVWDDDEARDDAYMREERPTLPVVWETQMKWIFKCILFDSEIRIRCKLYVPNLSIPNAPKTHRKCTLGIKKVWNKTVQHSSSVFKCRY